MTTHPEVPQATARGEAIAVVCKMLPTNLNYDWAAEILDALLLPRTVPCATCGGEGYELVESTLPTADIAKACPDCSDGSVTLGPLAVLVGELEQVNGMKQGVAFIRFGEPLFRAPFIEAQREEA